MTQNDVLRKFLSVLFCFSIIYLCTRFVSLDDLIVFVTICIGILLFLVILFIVGLLVLHIIAKYLLYAIYKDFKKTFDELKVIHHARYKLYFSSDKEKLKLYSDTIQAYGENVLDIGTYLINCGDCSETKALEIKAIMDKTEELMQKEFVAY